MNIIKSWNDRAIRIRVDRYVSLTDMAQACGKLFADWNRSKSAKSYLKTLSSVMQIPITDLIQVVQGGMPDEQGTWAHPKIALRFAQWCSDEFAVQVDFWIDELLTTGRVDLTDPTIAIYQQHHEQCRQQFLADSHRVELRNQLKAYRKNLNATIKAHFDRLNKVTPQSTYWKVADGLNLALTSETAKQMRSRTGLDSSQLIGDYMAERPLWFYTLAITVTTNLILCDRLPPLEAIKKAPELALPKDYHPEQIELVDPVKALEKRIDLYLSGQLTLPIPNTKVLAIA